MWKCNILNTVAKVKAKEDTVEAKEKEGTKPREEDYYKEEMKWNRLPS